jgi:hypothetical protein
MVDTITSKHADLQQISIYLPLPICCSEYPMAIDKAPPGKHWRDLDRILIKLWEFYSIRTRLLAYRIDMQDGGRVIRNRTEYLLPGLMNEGNAEFAEEFGEFPGPG